VTTGWRFFILDILISKWDNLPKNEIQDLISQQITVEKHISLIKYKRVKVSNSIFFF